MDGIDAHCPLCHHPQARRLYSLRVEGGTHFQTVKCQHCRFVYMWPRPDEAWLMGHYAEADVYALDSEKPEAYAAVIEDRKRLIREAYARLSLPMTGDAVDFGAGHGAGVKGLSDLGFDVVGVEISASARQAAQRLFDVEIRDGDLTQFAENSLSLVTMFDVLEHIMDLDAFLKTLMSRLAPGGVFIAGVPNFNSINRYLRGNQSKALYFPDHVSQFTASTLKACVGQNLEVLYVGSPPPYGVAITLGLRRALIRHFGQNAFTRAVSKFLVALKKHVVYPLPNAFVEKTGLLGQSLLIVARKD